MLSTRNDNNPAANLRKEYSRLMLIADLNAVREEAKKVVLASSISDKHRKKFLMVVAKISDLDSMRSYLTNFILAADGDRVLVRGCGEHDDTRRRLPELSRGSV